MLASRAALLLLKGRDENSIVLLMLWGIPIFSAALLLYLSVVPSFRKELGFANQGGFIEKLDDVEWKTLYADPRPGLSDWVGCAADAACPGKPGSVVLFAQGGDRGRGHAATVQGLRGKRYWLGRVFPTSKLRQWRARGATSLLIGYVYGTCEIFIDGERRLVRDGVTSRLPIIVDLPLQPAGDLYVALRILHDMDEPFPDVLSSGAVDPTQLEMFARTSEFQTLVKPALVLGYNSALGLLFAIMWLVSWKRQEFAGFATYCLVNAGKAALLIPFVWLHSGNPFYHRLNFVLTCYSVLSVVFIALTFARIRTWYTASAFTLLTAVPWLLMTPHWSPDLYFRYSDLVYRTFETASYFVAAALILMQAHLVAGKRGELIDPHREHKLYVVAFALVSTQFVHWAADFGLGDFRGVYTEAVMSVMMILVVQEFARQARSVSRSPLSKFHQLASPPLEIPCLVISLDLKNSERLFSLGAKQGKGVDIVKGLMQRLASLADAAGGELVSSEGDSLILMIAQNEGADESLRRSVALCLNLYDTLKDHLIRTHIPGDLELRMALDQGSIRPVWHEMGGKKIPGWEQVGKSTVFVDLARMLEAESKLSSKSETSLVVRPALASQLRRMGVHLNFEMKTATIKHGRRLELEIAALTRPVQISG